jgi:hypothetical protein
MIVNLTPHAICLNDGRIFPPSGVVARVTKGFVPGPMIEGVPSWREVVTGMENLPTDKDNVYIVSAMVLEAISATHDADAYWNVVAPSTGHPSTIRNEAGHIVSVAGFSGRR